MVSPGLRAIVYLLPAAKAFSLDEKATSPSVTRTANLFIQRFIDRGNRLGPRHHESKIRLMAVDTRPVMVHVI